MQTITFYEVTQNSDKTEGKGMDMPTGFGFYDKQEAIHFAESEDYAKKFGVMGCRGSKYDVVDRTIHIFSDRNDMIKNYDAIMKETCKKQALAKLTKEEREALGYA